MKALPERVDVLCTCERGEVPGPSYGRVFHWDTCPLYYRRFVPSTEQRHRVYDYTAELNQAVCRCDWQRVRELSGAILATLNR